MARKTEKIPTMKIQKIQQKGRRLTRLGVVGWIANVFPRSCEIMK